jgi:transcriptional regulator with XRE-family HTH domain
MKIKLNLKEKRENIGLTRDNIAERMGVTTVAICRWEKNNRTPKLEHIVMLMKILNVSFEELVTIE